MDNCKHENKKMIGFSFNRDMHDTTYECCDCKIRFNDIDDIFLYSYPHKCGYVLGNCISIDDLIHLGRKAEQLKLQSMNE